MPVERGCARRWLAWLGCAILTGSGGMASAQDPAAILSRMGTSAEEDDVGAAAFVLAARQAFPDALVQLVHLADQEVFDIELKPKPLEARRKKLNDFLAAIRAGRFPIDPSPRTCPGCPAFFINGRGYIPSVPEVPRGL